MIFHNGLQFTKGTETKRRRIDPLLWPDSRSELGAVGVGESLKMESSTLSLLFDSSVYSDTESIF